MSTKLPRGIRNNNPGNIELSKTKWQGQSSTQTDGRFIQFTDAAFGIRALIKVLVTYQDKYGLHTIASMIRRWAPPNENNTNAYIKEIAKFIGVGQDDPIDMRDVDIAFGVSKAIIRHENGIGPLVGGHWYEDSVIRSAVELAGINRVNIG